jgi:hypothetical protein
VADIDFQDSQQRTVALIEAMKEKLGSNFPSSNNVRIPNAWIVIAGEPPAIDERAQEPDETAN